MPEAVGDAVPEGGRSGEPKARTGGAAGSPPGRFAPGAEGGKWALLEFRGMPGGMRRWARSAQRRGFESAGAKPPRDGGAATRSHG